MSKNPRDATPATSGAAIAATTGAAIAATTGGAQRLLDDAHQQGTLSARSMIALDIVDVGAQIQAGLGVGVDDVAASEVVLVTLMPDDSGSIEAAGNTGAVRDGHNLVLDALASSKQGGDVLVHTRYLNGQVLCPYVALDQAVRMTDRNYCADKGTPLYDQTVVVLGTVLAKAQQLASAGIAVRTVTLLITDGADAGSRRSTAADVRALVDDLRAQEGHIVAGLGIRDGSTDFRAVFASMGIPDRWILTAGNSASEIRRAFQVFSQSAVAVGAGGALSVGAFGN
jgi:hypothetical protein